MNSPQASGRAGSERGASIAELAMALPVFFLLVFGVLDFGYYFYVAVSATSAAREGARQCTLVSLGACGNCDPTAASDYMDGVGMGEATVATADCSEEDGTIMYTVDVEVDFPTITGFPLIAGALPNSSTVGNVAAYGRARMRGQ